LVETYRRRWRNSENQEDQNSAGFTNKLAGFTDEQSTHKLLSLELIDQSAKQVIIHVFYDLNLIPTHIDQEIVRKKNKKSLNYTDLSLIFHWDSAVPAFAPSAVHTGLINRPIRPIPAPNSPIFVAPKPISPQAEADREDLGPE
jgi:hypothetical protein